MAPLRVIFLMMIIVTVVSTVTGDSSTRGSSKFDILKNKFKDSSSKFGGKLKAISGSSKAQKAKGWGKKVSDKHPVIKDKGDKLWGKVSTWTHSAKDSKQGKKARGLVGNYQTKAKDLVKTVTTQLKHMKTVFKGAKTASNIKSKVSGVTKTFTKKRSVGGSTTALKDAIQAGSDKLGTLKKKGQSSLAKLQDSKALNNLKKKVPKSGLDRLKKLPGADKLKGLASGSVAGSAGSKSKDPFSSLKSAAAGLANPF